MQKYKCYCRLLKIRFGDPEINRNSEKGIYKLTNKTTEMGLEELILDPAKKEGKL